VPVGYLISTGLMAACVLFAIAPPRPRESSPFRLSFWFGFLVNELPFVAFDLLVASTVLAVIQNGVHSSVFWAGLALAVAAALGLAFVVGRALRTRPAVELALREGLGSGWQTGIDGPTAARQHHALPLARILFAPFFFRRRDVVRVRNIRYGDAGRAHLLDLYRPRSPRPGAPLLVHLHGGAFLMGRKSREARALLYRLASQGWVCVSANYRLRHAATRRDQLIDVKGVLAWIQKHGREYGADPAVVFVAGSSAGAHLAALAALTPNRPEFQPGFEDVDTAVRGAICLYGYYGSVDGNDPLASSLRGTDGSDAPPFFVAHGDLDTLVVADDVRRFVERLRSKSQSPVVYAELPGGQHSFDLFHSIRFEAVIDGVEAFAAWVMSGPAAAKVAQGLRNVDGVPSSESLAPRATT
jgi:acetyl esterase/lipase